MPDFALEEMAGARSGRLVVGVDEVGRGPLAGPVVAAAVLLPLAVLDDERLAGLDDSKRLSAHRREILAERIAAEAPFGIGVAEVAEIDRLNILQAAMAAMRRAVDAVSLVLDRMPDMVLVDGNRVPELPCPGQAVVKGDGRSLSIAAASIVAKVHRDRLMADLARTHPEFGWAHNAGYGTAEHIAALARFGPTPHHRMSFRPVREAVSRK